MAKQLWAGKKKKMHGKVHLFARGTEEGPMGVCRAGTVPSHANAWWTVKTEPTLAFVCFQAVPNHVTATAGPGRRRERRMSLSLSLEVTPFLVRETRPARTARKQ